MDAGPAGCFHVLIYSCWRIPAAVPPDVLCSTSPAALAPLNSLPLRDHLLGGSPVTQPPSMELLQINRPGRPVGTHQNDGGVMASYA